MEDRSWYFIVQMIISSKYEESDDQPGVLGAPGGPGALKSPVWSLTLSFHSLDQM